MTGRDTAIADIRAELEDGSTLPPRLNLDQLEVMLSAAISLKRIAASLETIAKAIEPAAGSPTLGIKDAVVVIAEVLERSERAI